MCDPWTLGKYCIYDSFYTKLIWDKLKDRYPRANEPYHNNFYYGSMLESTAIPINREKLNVLTHYVNQVRINTGIFYLKFYGYCLEDTVGKFVDSLNLSENFKRIIIDAPWSLSMPPEKALKELLKMCTVDDRAVEVRITTIDGSDLVGSFQRVRRIGNVDGAGLNTGDLIGFLGFLHVDVLGNGLALIVAGVGIQVDDAIAVLIEGVSASTHGVAGDGTNLAQVALLEAVGVVVVIIQAAVAIVIQGGDRQLQLVDHGVGQLSGGDGHAVIAGLDNAGNGVNVSAGGNTGGGVSINISRNQVRQSRTCGLSFHGSSSLLLFMKISKTGINIVLDSNKYFLHKIIWVKFFCVKILMEKNYVHW